MSWIVAVAAAVFLVGLYLAARSGGASSSGVPPLEDEDHEPRPDSASDYRLEYHDAGDEYGRGFVVVRNEDGQRVEWNRLPEQEGMRSLEVTRESWHREELKCSTFEPGSRLSLVPAPGNPDRDRPVAVLNESESRQAGYVGSGEAERWVLERLRSDDGLECYAMWEKWRDLHRVSLRLLVVEPDASLDRTHLDG